jgi:hypothetical protein
MPGEMHWGPFTLQWSLLSWAVALLAGYYLMYWRLRSDLNESLNNELLTIISNALFAYLVVWKFGAVISDIQLIWTRPLGIILYSGGQQETYYGMAAAAVAVLYSLRKRSISIRPLADLLPWGILGCVLVYQLCSWRFKPLNVSVCIVSIGAFLGLLQLKPFALGSGLIIQRFCISYGLGLLLLTLFEIAPAKSLLGTGQLGFASLVLFGLFTKPLLTFIDYSFIVHPNERKERDDMDDPIEKENGA